MMISVLLAIGIGVATLLVLCCLWWAVWKLRHCMRGKQIFATLEEILVENRKVLKKDAVCTFPIVTTSDQNVDTSSKLTCPMCWLPFRNTDIMRQLPHCGHCFHRHCIDPVLENQTICPVCGTVLTKASEELNGRSPHSKSEASSPKHVTTPSWVLVNRPVPLPRNAMEDSSSFSERFEIELDPNIDSFGLSTKSPLLKYLNGSHEVEWNNVDIDLEQKCIDISFTFGTDIPVEKRKESTDEKGVDSFSFSTDTSNATLLQKPPPPAAANTSAASGSRSQLRRSRGRESRGRESTTSFSSDSSAASTRLSRSTSRSSRSANSSSHSSFQKLASWEYGAYPHLEEMAEHLPLTKPPHKCSFDVLPVVSSSGSYAMRDSRDLP